MNIDEYEKLTGKSLGNITLLKIIGTGSMGVVFIGYQNSLKRKVAVKILPRELNDEARREKFREEAELVAGLDHPNINMIFEIGEEEGYFFQVMKLITGGDLDKMIKKRRRHPVPSKRVLPLDKTLEMISQILDGLAYAHEEEIIHQDIKPANILIDGRSSRPLIGDFGIARTAQDEYRSRGIIAGSPLYLAPEQTGYKDFDHRVDIYAVSVMLFKMLAGALPVRKESVQTILKRKINMPESVFIKRPSECSRFIDSDLEKIILKGLEPDPEDRFKGADEFAGIINEYRETCLT